jgi:small basic protein
MFDASWQYIPDIPAVANRPWYSGVFVSNFFFNCVLALQ